MMLFKSLVFLFLAYANFLRGDRILPSRDAFPHIVSHRGASGYVPEHSIQAYQLAVDLKTDYIEPDLCLTKDGIFVVMHDVTLDSTTNVADIEKFKSRYTTKVVDPATNATMTGWFVCDFLLDELMELRLLQRISSRTTLFNGYFQIPAFDSVMAFAHESYEETGRMIGIYPELKRPSFHRTLGFNMEKMVLSSLLQGGYPIKGPEVCTNLSQVVPVVIQCFDAEALRYLGDMTDIPLVYLTKETDFSQSRMNEIATFAQIYAPTKDNLESVPFHRAKEIVDTAHKAGLYVHPYTFRADDISSPKFQNNFYVEEMYFYCCLRVDGLFSEFPDRSRETIDLMSNYTSFNYDLNYHRCTIDCHDMQGFLI